jgi:hypothetical protein
LCEDPWLLSPTFIVRQDIQVARKRIEDQSAVKGCRRMFVHMSEALPQFDCIAGICISAPAFRDRVLLLEGVM